MEEKAIIITLGSRMLKEKGYKYYLQCFKDSTVENSTGFFYGFNARPKKEFNTVYIVVGSIIRWKADFYDWYEESNEVQLKDGRIIKKNNFAILNNFRKIKNKKYYEGFRSFRYYNDEILI